MATIKKKSIISYCQDFIFGRHYSAYILFGVLSKYLHYRYNISIGKYGYGGDADTEKAKTCEHLPPVHRIRPPISL